MQKHELVSKLLIKKEKIKKFDGHITDLENVSKESPRNPCFYL